MLLLLFNWSRFAYLLFSGIFFDLCWKSLFESKQRGKNTANLHKSSINFCYWGSRRSINEISFVHSIYCKTIVISKLADWDYNFLFVLLQREKEEKLESWRSFQPVWLLSLVGASLSNQFKKSAHNLYNSWLKQRRTCWRSSAEAILWRLRRKKMRRANVHAPACVTRTKIRIENFEQIRFEKSCRRTSSKFYANVWISPDHIFWLAVRTWDVCRSNSALFNTARNPRLGNVNSAFFLAKIAD